MQITAFQTHALADMHVHVRQAQTMGLVAPHTARWCAACLCMPNTTPPLDDPDLLKGYLEQVRPLMPRTDVKAAFHLNESHTPDDIDSMAEVEGVVAGKIYPRGVTTNSDHGISWETIGGNPGKLDPALQAMERNGMVLCIHAETPHAATYELNKTESAFVPFLQRLNKKFTSLKVVVEHVTTAAVAAEVARCLDHTRFACTVTPQHMLWATADLFDGGLRPLRYCKPVYKGYDDREMIWTCLLSSENFFLGSDSAPHPVEKKLMTDCCAAGVYNAPVLAPLLADLFESRNRLDVLGEFAWGRPSRYYGLTTDPGDVVNFTREPWKYEADESQPPCPWDGHTFGWKAERSAPKPIPTEQPDKEKP